MSEDNHNTLVKPIYKCDVCFCDLPDNPTFWCWECESNLCRACTEIIYPSVFRPAISSVYHTDSEPSPWGACPFCFGLYPSQVRVLDDILKKYKIDYKEYSRKFAKSAKAGELKQKFLKATLEGNNFWQEFMKNKQKEAEEQKKEADVKAL